jgi:hypothetical protein
MTTPRNIRFGRDALSLPRRLVLHYRGFSKPDLIQRFSIALSSRRKGKFSSPAASPSQSVSKRSIDGFHRSTLNSMKCLLFLLALYRALVFEVALLHKGRLILFLTYESMITIIKTFFEGNKKLLKYNIWRRKKQYSTTIPSVN